MVVPLAVAPSNPNPGVHLTVDLLRGASSPGAQGLRALLLSVAEDGNTNMTADTQVELVASKEDVFSWIGRGPGYYAIQAYFANDPQGLVDLIRVTSSAGAAATQTLTFAGSPDTDLEWELVAKGQTITLEWPVGDTPTEAAVAAVGRINALVDRLPFTVSNAAGVVTGTANAAGPWGNDIKLRLKQTRGNASGTATLGGSSFSGGSTEIDLTQALATAASKEYDEIIPCLSNADVQSAAGTSNPQRIKDHINGHNTGNAAKLQQAILGSTGTRSAAQTGTVALNEPTCEHYCLQHAEDLPCECAAAEAGDRMRRRRLESNANRIWQPLMYLLGAQNKEEETANDQQFTDAANNGVTVGGYTAGGQPRVERPITTYSKDSGGNQDRRAFDVNEIDALYDCFKDLRAFIPQTYLSSDGQVKITRDIEPGDDPPPQGVVEEREVKASLRGRILGYWVPKGVIDGAKFRSADAAGEFIVEVNDGDETQLDIFLPLGAFKVLAKISLYGAKV